MGHFQTKLAYLTRVAILLEVNSLTVPWSEHNINNYKSSQNPEIGSKFCNACNALKHFCSPMILESYHNPTVM